MKKYIAYFDFLGFKDFIEHNDSQDQHVVIDSIFRDIERALSKAGGGQLTDRGQIVVNDISASKINALNFSDTVVFWSNDDSEASLKEMLIAVQHFNLLEVIYNFPIRGALVHGELFYVPFAQRNEAGGVYNINSVYGKGLVTAHQKAESLDWAGTVVDQSCLDAIKILGIHPEKILTKYCKQYAIPYKTGHSDSTDEFAFQITNDAIIDQGTFDYFKSLLEKNFVNYKKRMNNSGVETKLQNTISFLKRFVENT